MKPRKVIVVHTTIAAPRSFAAQFWAFSAREALALQQLEISAPDHRSL